MEKKIKIISFVLPIAGLFVQFAHSTTNSIYNQTINLLTSLNINLLGILSWDMIELGQIYLYLLFLTGAILYTKSAGREARLLRFIFAVMFLNNIIYFFLSIMFLLLNYRTYSEQDYYLLFSILSLIKYGTFTYLSYHILVYLNKSKALKDEIEVKVFNPHYLATKWQRFANIAFDSIICLSLYSQLAFIMQSAFLEKIGHYFGENTPFIIGICLTTLIYYLLFEVLFGATPGKFLTETRVLNDNGKTPTVGDITIRTFGRRIPLNSISFFGTTGWHDAISKTYVVQEERTGVKGELYLWCLIPIGFYILVWGIPILLRMF